MFSENKNIRISKRNTYAGTISVAGNSLSAMETLRKTGYGVLTKIMAIDITAFGLHIPPECIVWHIIRFSHERGPVMELGMYEWENTDNGAVMHIIGADYEYMRTSVGISEENPQTPCSVEVIRSDKDMSGTLFLNIYADDVTEKSIHV